MAWNLQALLVFTWASCPSLSGAAVQNSSVALLQRGPTEVRNEVCRYCHKLCPISCFVGTCDLHSGFTTRKYESTNQCYSCDPAVSVGVNKDGDFQRCEADESGASASGASPFSQQQSVQQGPQGPAVPGNAGLAALKASHQAQKAVIAATKASIWADKAAKAATAQYREATGSGANAAVAQAFSSEAQAENHERAAQIRAEEALRVAEAAHTAWKAAMEQYNRQIAKLRAQEIVTNQAEKALEAAEKASEKARSEYAAMQGEAQHAMQMAMQLGGSAASKITSQAAAEELAGAAMAAHRRLINAAKEAKDASEKISMASAMTPCVATLLQTDRAPGAPPAVGCMSLKDQEAQERAFDAANHPVFQRPRLPAAPPPPASTEEPIEGLGDIDPEPAVPAEGQLEVPSIEQQLQTQLAEKIETNPAAVNDAAIFSVPQVPFSAQQTPVDGTEQVAPFDLSTISTLQVKQRKMLRQNALKP